MNDVEKAELTVRNLENIRKHILVEQSELADERGRVALSAHTGDKKSRSRLDEINIAAAKFASEFASIEAAISQASRYRTSQCETSGVTRFDFIGTGQGRKITWTFEGDPGLNVFKQLAPQTGGKFNRSVQNGLACFVGFDDEGLDDPTSTICYRRSTLRKIIGWDRKSGNKYPLP